MSRAFIGWVAAGALLAGCASGSADTGATITISGSSTVEPISSLVAEKFAAQHPDVSYAVDGPGTGDGFARFCAGQTDISDASRTIAEEEARACAENGVEWVELRIAIDGLSVITSSANDAVSCLDFADLYALLGPESQGFAEWSDADALGAELGAGHTPYPDLPLQVTAPGEESGTFDSFVEIVIDGIAAERGVEATTRPDYTASADDNVIVQGIAGSEGSLGWVGFAFANENRDVVRLVEIDGGDGCVAATPETIADGSYPISRPLFIYGLAVGPRPPSRRFSTKRISAPSLPNVGRVW